MKDTRNSDQVPCRDIDPAELFEQGVAPEAYHNLQEVTQDVISDRSCCKIAVIEEQCSRCSAKIFGLRILGDVPDLIQTLKEMIYDVYEAFYEDPRSVQHVDLGEHMVELGQDALIELFKSLQLAAGLGREDAEDGTDKRSKQEILAQILGPEYANGD